MAFRFGDRSIRNLQGVHPRLVAVAQRAIEVTTQDFMVIEGVRTPQRQRELYAQGRTAPGRIVTWTLNSNHFINPRTGFGHAIDICPFPVDWNTLSKFDAMAAAMFQAADELGTPIRWGADWDRDGRYRERGETDSPHFELWGL